MNFFGSLENGYVQDKEIRYLLFTIPPEIHPKQISMSARVSKKISYAHRNSIWNLNYYSDQKYTHYVF